MNSADITKQRALGSTSLSDLQTMVRQTEDVLGPLVNIGVAGTDSLFGFDQGGDLPATALELQIGASTRKGFDLVCQGDAFVSGARVRLAAYRAADTNALTRALRLALRTNEIGDETPYQLYFAKKGNSGASFGFTQGDLAAGQAVVRDTFQNVLAAARVAPNQIESLTNRLSVQLTQNPLSRAEADLVNEALASDKGQPLVDAMDEVIFQTVCKELDKCVASAARASRVIDPEAQIYMLLWINMSGKPTELLDWLEDRPVDLANPVGPPGKIVTAGDIENYLRATKFFSENPRNFRRLQTVVAEAAGQLEGTIRIAGGGSGDAIGTDRSGSEDASSAGVARLSARSDVDLQATRAIQQLVAIVGEATKLLPDRFRVVVNSTFRPGSIVAGTGGTSQHALGNAIDVQIIDPVGQPIANKGQDDTGLYRRLAVAAFHANARMFPEREGQLAWGGKFTTGPANGPRDLMHFDYAGDRGRFGTLAQEARTDGTGTA